MIRLHATADAEPIPEPFAASRRSARRLKAKTAGTRRDRTPRPQISRSMLEGLRIGRPQEEIVQIGLAAPLVSAHLEPLVRILLAVLRHLIAQIVEADLERG